MNHLYEEQLSGEVVDADGRGRVCQELVGGPCRYCGRTGYKTRFCEVCWALVCQMCLNSTRCDVLPPDRGMWSHGRAMVVRREERERVLAGGRGKSGSDAVASSLTVQRAAQRALGASGETSCSAGSSESLEDA